MPSWEGSGCAADGLQRVMRGDHIGTLFHKDAHLWVEQKETGARDMAVAARDGSRRLQVCFISVPLFEGHSDFKIQLMLLHNNTSISQYRSLGVMLEREHFGTKKLVVYASSIKIIESVTVLMLVVY